MENNCNICEENCKEKCLKCEECKFIFHYDCIKLDEYDEKTNWKCNMCKIKDLVKKCNIYDCTICGKKFFSKIKCEKDDVGTKIKILIKGGTINYCIDCYRRINSGKLEDIILQSPLLSSDECSLSSQIFSLNLPEKMMESPEKKKDGKRKKKSINKSKRNKKKSINKSKRNKKKSKH